MAKVLIIGAGLAGTISASMLEQNGHKIRLVGHTAGSSASRKAAGVWNPVVVKRFVKTWLAEETVDWARQFYPAEEKRLGLTFFHTTGMLKLFANEAEKQQFLSSRDALSPFVDPDTTHPLPEGVFAPVGSMLVKTAGYLDVPAYLDACRDSWQQSGQYTDLHFDYRELLRYGDGWTWKGELFDKVLFCEGASATGNPYLKDLPLKGNKGQVLTLKIPGLESTTILNRQVFVLPANGNYRMGSTYEWNYPDEEPDEKGREELLSRLGTILPDSRPAVLAQEAGIRPTTPDRRPILGELPEKGLYVFNGLGSRGVLLAPYLAHCLLLWMDGDSEAIPREARLQRFID